MMRKREIERFDYEEEYHAKPKIQNSNQTENIFQTKCKIKENMCDLIIDGEFL